MSQIKLSKDGIIISESVIITSKSKAEHKRKQLTKALKEAGIMDVTARTYWTVQ